ncbi:MAG: sensor histidine kinase [Crocinitomicaceae bacterium]
MAKINIILLPALMNLFTPPASKYQDVFDQRRFAFMWRTFVLMGCIFIGLTIVHLIENDLPNVFITVGATVAIVISLLISYATGKYTFGTILAGIAGSAINQMDLFMVVGSQKYVTILWIVCISLYVFYLLGPRLGTITFILNIIGVTISLVLIPKEVLIDRIIQRNDSDLISIIINLTVITVLLAYLMNQILKSSKIAERESKTTQRELRKQYVIVQKQNEEKTVMLKEIHHRVKNNLQVITSLLRLQSKEIKDQKSIEHFNDAVQRVLAMSQIHERMYQSKDLSKIDLEDYLRQLAEELIQSYAVDKPIELHVNCEIQYIQPKSLVSFALMFNELISNTLKHAFSDMDKGKIEIRILRTGEDEVQCYYYDNGVWKDYVREGSFGMELINDLADQLDGTYTRNTESGTTYHFIFKYEPLA